MTMTTDIIPVCLPSLPLVEHILPYLHQIDRNRWYTNYGPLVRELSSRVSKMFQLEPANINTAANGTLLLELCLKALNIPKNSLCIMPSWTFVATPLAAVNANLQPWFVDVDCKTQTIHPDVLEKNLGRIATQGKIGAVIAVTPFGMPINTRDWDDFTARTGIPVIIDAAAGFDTLLNMPQMTVGNTPIMVSLHATKVLGAGEAAILLSKNKVLTSRIEHYTQFGFLPGIRNAEYPGTNAKISEYTAAVALAALDQWYETREGWKKISDDYQFLLNQRGIQHTIASDWVTSTCNIILPELADSAMAAMNKRNIMTRKWYESGCHRHTVFKQCLTSDLTNTKYLASSMLGLPFYIGMEKNVIEKIIDAVAEFMHEVAQERIHAAGL